MPYFSLLQILARTCRTVPRGSLRPRGRDFRLLEFRATRTSKIVNEIVGTRGDLERDHRRFAIRELQGPSCSAFCIIRRSRNGVANELLNELAGSAEPAEAEINASVWRVPFRASIKHCPGSILL